MDESRFSDAKHSQCQLISTEFGTQFHSSNITERDSYFGSGVVVWEGIMLKGWTELHVCDRGSVTGHHYYKEVIFPHVRLIQGAIGPDFGFMDDNACSQRTADVHQLPESEDVTRIDWPVFSPYLNPIGHVWDALWRLLTA
ncbi:transposable element Tcb2 transposase [Trichonephila clavipes]|nr:transposable element Tcb2 transposase [Trichonephila clavipes]